MSDEKIIAMCRCGASGSIFTCACEPRFTDLDVGPDYSCEQEVEVKYICVSALLGDAFLRDAFFPFGPDDSSLLPVARENMRRALAASEGEENER